MKMDEFLHYALQFADDGTTIKDVKDLAGAFRTVYNIGIHEAALVAESWGREGDNKGYLNLAESIRRKTIE